MRRYSFTILLLFFVIINTYTRAQINFQDELMLILDRDTSIILPSFDTSAILGSNIKSITLSLYVLDKNPGLPSDALITINPIDLQTKVVDDGLSTSVNVVKDGYVDFHLPRELFERTIGTPKTFLLHLVSKDQKITFAGPEINGTTQDPRLIIVSTEGMDVETQGRSFVVNYNFGTISNTQLHFGTGDNVGNNKNASSF